MNKNQNNTIKDKFGNEYRFKELYELKSNQTEYHIMFFNNENKNIGSIFAVTRKNGKNTEIEYYIHDKKYEGRGIATAMLQTMTQKLFEEDQLHTIPHQFKPKYTSALDTVFLTISYNDEQKNEASLRVAQKCGFYTPEPKYGGVSATLTRQEFFDQKAKAHAFKKQLDSGPKTTTPISERVA